jgi:hypothetical protein
MSSQRFLDETGQCKGTWFSPQDGHVAFGFGRRIWWVTQSQGAGVRMLMPVLFAVPACT